MGDDDDSQRWDDFGEIVRTKMRGANDYWYWRDKPEMEVGVAREVLQCFGYAVEQLRSRENDPPDCEAVIDAKRVGIEVTELTHEPTLKSTIKGKGQYFLWKRDDLLFKLQDLIRRKDRAEVNGGPYDRYILIIVTDEFALGRDDVARFLGGAKFRAQHITSCFFGLSYDPSIATCPVFELSLDF